MKTNEAPWIKCQFCDEFWCTIHDQHACDCPCPPIDEWEIDPYSPMKSRIVVKVRNRLVGLISITAEGKYVFHPAYHGLTQSDMSRINLRLDALNKQKQKEKQYAD